MTNNDLLVGLAAHIAQSWQSFSHAYEIKKKGRTKPGASSTVPWKCVSLRDACRQYQFKGKDRDQTNSALGKLSSKLQSALTSSEPHSHALHHLCLEVLEWGGVEGASSKWLRENCQDQLLQTKIQTAVALLSSAAAEIKLTAFDGSDLVMNSGLTKVYALAAPKEVIIYDGRLGAAIGLFALQFLRKKGITDKIVPCGQQLSAVPEVLQFPWGDGLAAEDSRNPSVEPYFFPQLRPGSHFVHAHACWKASKVLRLALEAISQIDETVTLRDLEMALFMVGYRVA